MSAPSTAYLKASTHLVQALTSFLPTFTTFFQSHPILSPQSWFTYYAVVDPMHTAIVLCAVASTGVYVAQQLTGNASQVDRIWTFAPVWYGAHFVLQPFVGAKLISLGLADEKLIDTAGWAADPAGKVAFLARKTFQDSSASAQIQPRLALMLALQLVWSTRLTYNAWRRGFFKKGEEDYRWPELRKGMNRVQWELFAFGFIAIIQNILLAATALPQYLLLTTTFSTTSKLSPGTTLNLQKGDYILAGIFLLNLLMEFFADHQQQIYQNFKRGMVNPLFGLPHERKGKDDFAMFDFFRRDDAVFTEADKKRGFVAKGLWAWSRHPNFACEQMVWWLLFSFVPLTFHPALSSKLASTSSLGEWFKYAHPLLANYAILSPVFMSLLFIASTDFTEKMSMAKYPEYVQYRKAVAPFNPLETAIRRVYYLFVAGKKERESVKEAVWGTPKGKKE